MGEAANRISPAFQAEHPAVPWKDIIEIFWHINMTK
jgi:uncharacterized protein with HEPN domain